MKKYLIIFVSLIFSNVLAWDGYDYETGGSIEIESGNTVREGNDIEFYDYNNGNYHSGEVNDINGSGSGTEVEVYDYDTGEYRTFDMDD